MCLEAYVYVFSVSPGHYYSAEVKTVGSLYVGQCGNILRRESVSQVDAECVGVTENLCVEVAVDLDQVTTVDMEVADGLAVAQLDGEIDTHLVLGALHKERLGSSL